MKKAELVALAEERVRKARGSGIEVTATLIADALPAGEVRSVAVQAHSDGKRFAWIDFVQYKPAKVYL